VIGSAGSSGRHLHGILEIAEGRARRVPESIPVRRLAARSDASCRAMLGAASLLAMRRLVAALVLTLCAVDGLAAPVASQQPDAVVVYLVRHAERADDGTDDPPISAAGEERARLLAEMLRDASVTHIHTTDFRRTRATAAPLAARARLVPALYDDDLATLAARIAGTPGRHLVVGHSNTIPVIVSALGGDAGNPTIAQEEYDRLYILTLSGGRTATVLLRFGAPYARPF
jgi:broad specificity phosphatase PhoE